MLPNNIDIMQYQLSNNDVRLIRDEILSGNEVIERLFYNYAYLFDRENERLENEPKMTIHNVQDIRNNFLGIIEPLF
jgi:hypothetical protein